MRDPIKDKARGNQAAMLLRDEILQEALKEVRYVAHRAFETAAGDAAKLQRAADLLEAANAFQRHLIALMTMGEAATKKIDAEMNQGAILRGIGRRVRNREAVDMPWSRVA